MKLGLRVITQAELLCTRRSHAWLGNSAHLIFQLVGLLVLPVFGQQVNEYTLPDFGELAGIDVQRIKFRRRKNVDRPRVLLADDHEEMRDRIKRHLEVEFDVVEAVENGRTLLDAAARLKPDVCVLDISMPVVNGIEAAMKLKECGSTAKVLFLTIHEDPDFLQAALNTGAAGYVLKRRIASDLRPAIRDALAGKTFISSSAVFPRRKDV